MFIRRSFVSSVVFSLFLHSSGRRAVMFFAFVIEAFLFELEVSCWEVILHCLGVGLQTAHHFLRLWQTKRKHCPCILCHCGVWHFCRIKAVYTPAMHGVFYDSALLVWLTRGSVCFDVKATLTRMQSAQDFKMLLKSRREMLSSHLLGHLFSIPSDQIRAIGFNQILKMGYKGKKKPSITS